MLRSATAGGAGHGSTTPPGDAAVPASRTPSRSTSSRSRTGPSGRPVLSPAEMLALREALALRQTLAAGQTLTPEQAAALRLATSVASRTGPARTAAGRPAAKRTPTRKPASRTAPARAKRARTKADRPKAPRTGARWSTRLKVVALSTVLLPAVASLALPAGRDAGPGGGPLDVTALALTTQSSLLESAGEYRRLEQEAAARATDLRQAHEAQAAALA